MNTTHTMSGKVAPCNPPNTRGGTQKANQSVNELKSAPHAVYVVFLSSHSFITPFPSCTREQTISVKLILTFCHETKQEAGGFLAPAA